MFRDHLQSKSEKHGQSIMKKLQLLTHTHSTLMWTCTRMALAKKQKTSSNIKNSDTIHNSNNSNNSTQYLHYPTYKISMVSVKCTQKCEENKNAPFSMHCNLVAGICPFCTHFPFTSIRSLQRLLFTAIFSPPRRFSPFTTQPTHILKCAFFSLHRLAFASQLG